MRNFPNTRTRNIIGQNIGQTQSFDVGILKRQMLAQAEQVCRHLLPAGKIEGKEWCCGNLRGDSGHSLKISLASGVWRDFATGESGSNLLELWRQVRSTDFATAFREAAAFCNLGVSEPPRLDDAARKRTRWPVFAIGSRRDLLAVANLRGISLEGVELASVRGLLWFTDWHNHPCWIVTDSRRVNAQARRMDGKSLIVRGEGVKALTLPGSRAGVPLGLDEAKGFSAVAVVEGGPDLLAAHECIWAEDRKDVAAVAMLGAGHRPSPTIWSPLAGKSVRVYCHRDTEGMKAGQAWGKDIRRAGAAKIDAFRFDGLQRADGSPVGDLNEFLHLHPNDFETRREVWEVLP